MRVEIKLSKEKFTELVQNILHNMAYVDAEIIQNLTIVQTTGVQRETLKILYEYGEQCVKEISHKLGKVHPQISHELNVLKRKGIVASERRGKKAYYKIRDEHREALDALFSLPDDVRSEAIKVANLLAEAENVSAELFERSLPEELSDKQKAEITQNLTIELGENEEFQIILTVKK